MSILNDQSGGEKAFVEVTEKQTHFALVSGAATIQPRGADGNFVSIGTRLKTGEQACVTGYTLTGEITPGRRRAAPATAAPRPRPRPGVSGAPPRGRRAPARPRPRKPPASRTASLAGDARSSPPSGEAVRSLGATGQAKAHLSEQGRAGRPRPPARSSPAGRHHRHRRRFRGVPSALRRRGRHHPAGQQGRAGEAFSVAKRERPDPASRPRCSTSRPGTLVSSSSIPAKRNINNYGVRTPKGIATAQGTSFSVSVTDDNFSVAATADTVTFVTPSGGTNYSISAGNITITSASGAVQAPIPLSQAVAADPGLARVVQTAVNTASSVVRNNVGNLRRPRRSTSFPRSSASPAVAMPGAGGEFRDRGRDGRERAHRVHRRERRQRPQPPPPPPPSPPRLRKRRGSPPPEREPRRPRPTTIAASAANAVARLRSGQVATAVMQTHRPRPAASIVVHDPGRPARAWPRPFPLTVLTQAGPVTGALLQLITQAGTRRRAPPPRRSAGASASPRRPPPRRPGPGRAGRHRGDADDHPVESPRSATRRTSVTQTAAMLASAIISTAPAQAVPGGHGADAIGPDERSAPRARGPPASIAASVAQAAPGSRATRSTACRGDRPRVRPPSCRPAVRAVRPRARPRHPGGGRAPPASVQAGAQANSGQRGLDDRGRNLLLPSAAANVLATAGTTSSAGDTGGREIHFHHRHPARRRPARPTIANNLSPRPRGAQSTAPRSAPARTTPDRRACRHRRTPTMPVTLPADNTVSPANLTSGGT